MILKYDKGLNTTRDERDLENGEMSRATGVEYHQDDPTGLHRIAGRSLFGDTGTGSDVKGVALVINDSGTSRALAFSGTTVYSKLTTTGSFASLITDIDSDSSKMIPVHSNDNWYLAFGASQRPQVVLPDGTARAVGMVSPPFSVSATAGTGTGSKISASAASGTSWVDTANAYDATAGTFAYVSLETASSASLTASGFSSDTGNGRIGYITWELSGLPPQGVNTDFLFNDTGGQIDSGFNVTVEFFASEDSGSTFTSVYSTTLTTFAQKQTVYFDITDAVDTANVQFKATLTYNSGSTPARLRVYNVKIQKGGSSTVAFSTTTGIYYAIAEYNENSGLQGPATEYSSLVTLSSQNQVTLDLSAGPANSSATHWLIYRTTDGGTPPYQLGLVATVPIAKTSYIDDFSDYAVDDTPGRYLPLLQVTADEGTLYIPRDTPPPSVSYITAYQGSLVGLRGRNLYYSMSGLRESWPEIYVVAGFPMPENDTLVSAHEAGESLIVLAKATAFRIDGLPRVTNGNFTPGEANAIAGAPGCVGAYASTAVPHMGQQSIAWVAETGVYITNGHTYTRISPTIDFRGWRGFDKSSWVLHYDKQRRCLILAYSSVSGGDNDRYLLGHIERGEGRVDWTGPHYGKINHLASGQVGSSSLLLSGNPDGAVYKEDDQTTGLDASNAYNSSGAIPTDVLGPKRIQGNREYGAYNAFLYHSDFGSGQNATITWTTGRDSSNQSYSKEITASLANTRRTQFDVARGGIWHQERIFYDGTGSGTFYAIDVDLDSAGLAGKVGAS